MASQGLFTQGITVDDLLKQRRVRSQQQQQLMANQAAQGARDPQRARMGSMFGSIIGKALGDNAGGADSEMEQLKAANAQQESLQQQYGQGIISGTPESNIKLGGELIKLGYGDYGGQLLQKGQADMVTESNNKKATDKAVALQSRSATVGEDLSDWNPELSFRLVSGTATQKEYDEGIQELTAMNKALKGNGSNAVKGFTFNTAGTYTDENNNMYVATNTIKKADGTNTMSYTPIGNAPAYLDAKLSPVNSSGMTKDQRVAEALAKAKGEQELKKFFNNQEKAEISIGKTTTNLTDARRMGELLESVRTGGKAVVLGKAVSDFFGATPTDQQELDTISKTMMLSSLKSLLGGQLSDGERKAALEVQVSLDKGKGANKAIVDRYITIFESKLEREQALLSSGATGASYRQFLLEQSARLTALPTVTPTTTTQTAPTGTAAPSKTINWIKP